MEEVSILRITVTKLLSGRPRHKQVFLVRFQITWPSFNYRSKRLTAEVKVVFVHVLVTQNHV